MVVPNIELLTSITNTTFLFDRWEASGDKVMNKIALISLDKKK